MADATATSLSDGRYDRVSSEYYATFRELTSGTRFAALPAFYTKRDEHIIANILSAIRGNLGARIAIVLGADHHGPVVAALAREHRIVSLQPVRP